MDPWESFSFNLRFDDLKGLHRIGIIPPPLSNILLRVVIILI